MVVLLHQGQEMVQLEVPEEVPGQTMDKEAELESEGLTVEAIPIEVEMEVGAGMGIN